MMYDASEYLPDGLYDVGKVVRSLHDYYLGPPEPNRATKVHLSQLVARLRAFTEALPHEPAVANDRAAWEERLGRYEIAVREAPAGHSQYLAEHVAAPLLLGWYSGAIVQKPADVATPFSLANQSTVSRDFRQENLRRLVDELEERTVIATAGLGLWVAVAAVVWFVVLK
jgi:hypothetical protein